MEKEKVQRVEILLGKILWRVRPRQKADWKKTWSCMKRVGGVWVSVRGQQGAPLATLACSFLNSLNKAI